MEFTTEECLLATGSAPCSTGRRLKFSPPVSSGSEDNKKSAQQLDVCTGKSSPPLRRRNALAVRNVASVSDTGSPLGRRLQLNMSGRRPPPSPERASNSEENPCEETIQQIGIRFWLKQRREILQTFPVTSKVNSFNSSSLLPHSQIDR